MSQQAILSSDYSEVVEFYIRSNLQGKYPENSFEVDLKPKPMEKVRCQRIGCNATFTEDHNPEGSCTYHALPIFHDGMKEWSCCKTRSHDFSLFLQIPGCKTGKHTTEKLVHSIAPRLPNKPVPAPSPTITNASPKDTCSRCRQGFFCSDHGSQPRPSSMVPLVPSESNTDIEEKRSTPVKKIVDINKPQTCKNKGCGQTFKEKDNHDTACSYHPGPAIFHDRMRGWKCCDIHVKEFDEFMSIPPCSRGWHNAESA